MKIAIQGCCHGQLPTIYSTIQSLESANNYKVDLLLVCGDFQAIRNERDLQCMAVPDKYKELGEFYKYYTGEKKAPVLTIVIGGNHEASNYFWELFYGGWVAPNIYFLGFAGSVLVNGIRISGASGIFKAYNFNKGYFERQPYSKDDVRSIYHIRESAIRQLSLLPPSSPTSTPTTIFLSHDWPLDITSYAHPSAVNQLLRKKPHFKQEVAEGKLGSPPLMGLLNVLRPRWWFSAHLHVGFDVRIWWGTSGSTPEKPSFEKAKNPDEIVIDDEELEGATAEAPITVESTLNPSPASTSRNVDEIILNDLDGDADFDVAVPPPPPPPSEPPLLRLSPSEGWSTQFIALDKCLPKRKFLEVIDVDTPDLPTVTNVADYHSPSTSGGAMSAPSQATSGQSSSPILTYDPHWLAITRAFHPHVSLSKQQQSFPSENVARAMVEENLEWVRHNVPEGGKVRVQDIQQFAHTAPGPNSHTAGKDKSKQPPAYSNPQTEAFCRMLMVYNFVNPDGVKVSRVE
ncbi:hypothetical protein GYMLUDRAFT_226480 [Collybiopsis luxurians FD-317 M1]|uniref:Unplaced genomic scaffold GYMLUscaffold_30, whole genome shotgun sequence n=1 Tax=Collybiopsis luxurians FD-317 M1 TaxID=944289 RepID=A0A0D0CUW0_9AGAR|nr:hypothetical protein GYMLUDRAFT_226480 [Collybiopsis luxurians FD-317 M1]